jgi:hypothetical protein
VAKLAIESQTKVAMAALEAQRRNTEMVRKSFVLFFLSILSAASI